MLVNLRDDSALRIRWLAYVASLRSNQPGNAPETAAEITWWLLNGARLLLAVSTRIFATVEEARADLTALKEMTAAKALPWREHGNRFLLLAPPQPGNGWGDRAAMDDVSGISVRRYATQFDAFRAVTATTRSLRVGRVPEDLSNDLHFPDPTGTTHLHPGRAAPDDENADDTPGGDA